MEQFLSRLLGQATGEEFHGILEVSCCYFVCYMQRVVDLLCALRGDRVELAEDFGIYWRSPVPISPYQSPQSEAFDGHFLCKILMPDALFCLKH